MAVDREQLLRVAALARLRLDEDETARLAEQLNGILEHIEQLMQVDVDMDAQAPFALDPAPAGRDDVPAADPLLQPLSELAPGWRDDFFTVPRVLAP